uniref:Uncharacterized protein n=1 Tax=Vespula pensylvanica TaxID=30213 RepID=A0A834NLQ5_VESPE|nr:hypothetical protein H0235_012655 [Vespula pensylvanica]
MAGVLFEDIFNVKDIDPEGKKFDRGCCREKAHGVTVLYVYLKLENLNTLKKFVIRSTSTLTASFFLDKEYYSIIDRRFDDVTFQGLVQHTRSVCLPADSQQRRDVQTS